MAETYEAKLARRLKMRSKFESPLNEIPIRHVDKIAALSLEQRQLLGQAMRQNLRSIPLALERLETLGGDATVDLLLQDNKNKETDRTAHVGDVETLMDIMSECFPGMPQITIQSLAESAVMAEVLNVIKILREAFESNNIKSDFVVTILYAVIKFGKKTIEDQIKITPSIIQVIRQSGLTWDGDEQI
jgi:hypothetical protein